MLMETLYIIHGWHGNHTSDWYPWLRSELESRGIVVIVPDMPHTDTPTIIDWVAALPKLSRDSYRSTYFVGHSIGCQAILRYLELVPDGLEIGGAVLVAPWVKLKNLEEDENAIAKEWLETPIDWENVREHCSNFTVIYSDNDKYVPMENAKIFEKNLNAKLVKDSGKGHFSKEDGITKLLSVLEEMLDIIRD